MAEVTLTCNHWGYIRNDGCDPPSWQWMSDDESKDITAGQSGSINDRGYVEFDLTSIPDTATITKVELLILCKYSSYLNDVLVASGLHPRSYYEPKDDAHAGFDDIVNDPITSFTADSDPGSQPNVVDLGEGFCATLQSKLSDNWVLLGLKSSESTAEQYLFDYGGTYTPSLRVTYSGESASPSASPSPSVSPSGSESVSPSVSPSASPSPSVSPSASPSPSVSPSRSPSVSPSISPSVSPSRSPSVSPSVSPSASPSVSPSVSASVSPSASPSAAPAGRRRMWTINI